MEATSVRRRKPARRCRCIARAVPAFLLPVVFFCLIAASRGVYPFGAESFLTEDLKYQYIDLFTWYRGVLTGQESLLYTFSPSLGNNAWGIWSYYLASPLNILILLFPLERLTLAIFVISALRQGLMGVTTFFYLWRRFGLSLGPALALSLCLPCSLWVLTQLRNPMWMDAMVLLPLVAYSAWRLVRRERWGTLIVVLVMAIICCWYMGYMLVLASVCLCWLEWYVAPGEGMSRVCGARATALVCGSLCLTVLFGAWTLYPTVAAQLGSWSQTKTVVLVAASVILLVLGLVLLTGRMPDKAVRVMGMGVVALVIVGAIVLCVRNVLRLMTGGIDLSDLASRVTSYPLANLVSSPFIGTYQVNSSPQLWVGSALMVGSLFMLLDARLPRRLRVGVGAFLALAVASVVLRPLYFAWCGFRSPMGFNSRTAFLVVFAAIWATALYLARRPAGRPPRRTVVFAGLVAALSVPCSLVGPVHDVGAMVLGVILVLGCSALLFWGPPVLLATVLPVIALVELAVGGYLAWGQLYVGYPQDNYEAYVTDAARELAELRALDSGFYRVEKNFTRVSLAAWNEGFSQGFNRLASYLSSSNGAATSLLESLGYSDPDQFSSTYRSPILPSDTLLGVRYVFSSVPAAGLEPVALQGLSEEVQLFRNPDALSVGYSASANVTLETAVPVSENPIDPFVAQNDFASAILGREVELFSPLEARLTGDEAGMRSWTVRVPAGMLAYTWLCTDGVDAGYLYRLSTASTDAAAAWANDTAVEGLAWDNTRFSHAVRPIADIAEITRDVDVAIQSAEGVTGSATSQLSTDVTCLFYGLNLDVYHEVISELAEQQISVTQWSNALLAGSVRTTGDKDGLLISIPYDAGWTVRLDGEVVQAQPAFGGGMTFVPVADAGEHELEMTYVSPMLVEGVAVTAATAAVLVVRSLVRQRKARLRACTS